MFLLRKDGNKKLNNFLKVEEKGITLVSLIVIIAVTLILAAVTIRISSTNGGMVSKTKKGAKVYENTSVNESETMKEYGNYLKPNSYVPKAKAITFTATPLDWTKGDVKVTAATEESDYSIELKSKDSDWSVRKDNTITVTSNQQISARLKNRSNKYLEDVVTYEVKNIDKDAPDKTAPQLKATTNSITTTFKQKDSGSGVATVQYQIKKSSDTTWGSLQLNPIFNYLAQNTEYDVRTHAVDKVGNASDSAIATVTTGTIPTPVRGSNVTFTATPTTKTSGNVTVKVSTTVTGYTLQTSTNGSSWGTTNPLTFTANGTAYARLWDGTNASSAATLNITNIDKTNYSISYNLNGGTASGNPTSYKVDSSTITIKDPTLAGCKFLGWTGSNDLSSGLGNYTSSSPYVASGRDIIYWVMNLMLL